MTVEIFNKKNNVKETKSIILNRVREMKDIISQLEDSLKESYVEQKHLLIEMHGDEVKSQAMQTQLEEAKKENKQLSNILQRKSLDGMPRSQDPILYSISAVNLHSKYGELLAKFEGLLKIMLIKEKELQDCYNKKETLLEETNHAQKKLHHSEHTLKKVCDKYVALRKRKNSKKAEVKTQKESLWLAYNQIVRLINKQYDENEEVIKKCLQETTDPYRALFLKEIQRSNKLQLENITLKREIVRLTANCTFHESNLP